MFFFFLFLLPTRPENREIRTDFNSALSDHGAVGLIDDAVNLLEVVRIRDDLVAGDDVL